MTDQLAETTGTMASDAPVGTMASDAPVSPFTMMTGDPSAMVCEGDVCFVPQPGASR